MKIKTSVKMSSNNITFWKKMNVNAIKSDKIQELLSYSELQEVVVNYFKQNNQCYLQLLELLGKTEELKNGNKR